jgi:hypothetical protein
MMLLCNVIVKVAWIEAVDDDDGHYLAMMSRPVMLIIIISLCC